MKRTTASDTKTINTGKIKSFIAEKGYSKTAFAKKCKISYKVLIKILKNNDNFNLIALFKVARGMEVKIKDLFLTP